MAADALTTAWQDAEKSGDYSQIAGLLGGMSGPQLMSVYGLSPADLSYVNSKAGTSLNTFGGDTLAKAAAAVNTPATLTPEIAQDLMWRSMTTGTPTSEFDKYGGYDKVNSMYSGNGGGYGFDEMTPEFLDKADDIIANTGVGNLGLLKVTGQPLTKAALQSMNANGINWTDADLKSMGIPYEGFLKVPQKPTTTPTTPTTTTPQQAGVTPQVKGPLPMMGSDGGFNSWTAGAAGNSMLGAGNADYHSSLVKSLRQNSINPISNNQGVQFMQNRGSSNANWTPPTSTSGNMAFNPQVLNPRAASAQEVVDWNAYNTYRTNALNAKTPIVSFAEWLAGGKTGNKTTTPADPNQGGTNYPWDGGGGGGA